jgi:hypothetical protein
MNLLFSVSLFLYHSLSRRHPFQMLNNRFPYPNTFYCDYFIFAYLLKNYLIHTDAKYLALFLIFLLFRYTYQIFLNCMVGLQYFWCIFFEKEYFAPVVICKHCNDQNLTLLTFINFENKTLKFILGVPLLDHLKN